MTKHWYLIAVGIFLLGALGSWPYAYYQLLRWIVCGAASYTAYQDYNSTKPVWTWVFVIVAILFNPIVPFYLDRSLWQILDIIVAVFFLIFPFITSKHA